MKLLLVVVLLLSIACVHSLTEREIREVIKDLQKSESYLNQYILYDANSYQKQAMDAAARTLSDASKLELYIQNNTEKNESFTWSDKHIRNFYVAASIYFGTYGQPNELTPNDVQYDFELPGWKNDTNWIDDPDYCNWFGIDCSEDDIVSFILHQNSLYGIWPQEVGLLGKHLTTIDVYENDYLYTDDYSWFQSMDALENLHFGSTSWSADGIPSELNQLTNLIRLECFYSLWTEGPIRSEAFISLDQLEYVSMGTNIYTAIQGKEIPSSLQALPLLSEFDLDNTEFRSDNGAIIVPTMDFISKMEMLERAWFDFTLFDGGIPVLPSKLKSFSCISCGLSGGLDNISSANGANLEQVWLTNNQLTGTIPADIPINNPSLFHIQLEGNDLRDTKIPPTLCDQITSFQDGVIGADLNVCKASCCTCAGSECGYDVDDPVLPPEPDELHIDTSAIGGICFSGNSLVNVENRGTIKMSDLRIGDKVMVGKNKFESIYSFGHKNDGVYAKYIQISTDTTRNPLELSAAHMVTVGRSSCIPAALVKKGDKLLRADGELATVKTIKEITRRGAYAPFTNSGKIIVNNIVASNYIAYQRSEYLKIGEIETPFSYQWIAHTFNSLHRLAVMVGLKTETYTSSGISRWVDTAHIIFSWMLKQNTFVFSAFVFPSLFFFWTTSLLEVIFLNPSTMVGVILGVGMIYRYHSQHHKKSGCL